MAEKAAPPTLRSIMNQINKTVGADTVVLGSDLNYEMIPRISSGSLKLDVILGGGWPVNQWHEIYGEFCVTPETRILTPSLEWVAAGDLGVGNDVIGFGEDLSGQGRGRSVLMERAAVLGNEPLRLPCVRVVTTLGEVVVSEGHRFVARSRKNGQRVWRRADALKAGDSLLYTTEPWQLDSSWEAGYLAGVFDGEGWLDTHNGGARTAIGQNPGLVLDKSVELLKSKGYNVAVRRQSQAQECMSASVLGGKWETMRLLGSIRPERLLAKADAVWEGTGLNAKGHATVQGTNNATVLAVEPWGEQEVVPVTSSSHTFIAEGFPSHNSSGKTAIVNKTIATAQARDPNYTTWWLASEHFDPGYAKMCGIDVSRVLIHDTNVMEDGLQQILQVAETREVDCIVIDSYPALVPAAEDEGVMGGSLPGLGARINGQFWRKQGTATKRSLTSTDRPMVGFVINQPREKIGVMWGNPETTPGGRGKNFYYFIRVECRRADWIQVGTEKNKETIGITIKATTPKNKSHRPHRTATFDFYVMDYEDHVAGSYDTIKEVADLGMAYGIVELRGGTYYYTGEPFKGRAGLYTALREQPKLLEAISQDVMQVALHPGASEQEQAPLPPPPPRKVSKAVKKA